MSRSLRSSFWLKRIAMKPRLAKSAFSSVILKSLRTSLKQSPAICNGWVELTGML
jgi:hypothetical protein